MIAASKGLILSTIDNSIQTITATPENSVLGFSGAKMLPMPPYYSIRKIEVLQGATILGPP